MTLNCRSISWVWLGRMARVAALALMVFSAAILTMLVLDASLAKGVPAWAIVMILFVGLISIIATFVISFPSEGSWKKPKEWATPRFCAIGFALIFGALGTMESLYTILEPRNATKADTDRIIELLESDDLSLSGDQMALFEGAWGEAGNCSVLWKLAIADDTLSFATVETPDGERPFTLVSAITGTSKNHIEIRGLKPSSSAGQAATLRLESGEPYQRLFWIERAKGTTMEFERCD